MKSGTKTTIDALWHTEHSISGNEKKNQKYRSCCRDHFQNSSKQVFTVTIYEPNPNLLLQAIKDMVVSGIEHNILIKIIEHTINVPYSNCTIFGSCNNLLRIQSETQASNSALKKGDRQLLI